MLSKYDLIGVGVMLSPNPEGQVRLHSLVLALGVAVESCGYVRFASTKRYLRSSSSFAHGWFSRPGGRQGYLAGTPASFFPLKTLAPGGYRCFCSFTFPLPGGFQAFADWRLGSQTSEPHGAVVRDVFLQKGAALLQPPAAPEPHCSWIIARLLAWDNQQNRNYPKPPPHPSPIPSSSPLCANTRKARRGFPAQGQQPGREAGREEGRLGVVHQRPQRGQDGLLRGHRLPRQVPGQVRSGQVGVPAARRDRRDRRERAGTTWRIFCLLSLVLVLPFFFCRSFGVGFVSILSGATVK